jgi:hypothetical protein
MIHGPDVAVYRCHSSGGDETRRQCFLIADQIMHSDVLDNANIEIAAAGARERRRYNLSVGLVCSVLLHGLLLPAFILMLYSSARPHNVLLAIPVNIVELSDETTGPPQPDKALVPQQRAAEPSSPVAEPVGISRLTKPPLPDALETKLRMLAKLQQPVVDTHLLEKEVGRSRISAMSASTCFLLSNPARTSTGSPT